MKLFLKKILTHGYNNTDESRQLPLKAVFSITNKKKLKKKALNARNFYLLLE